MAWFSRRRTDPIAASPVEVTDRRVTATADAPVGATPTSSATTGILSPFADQSHLGTVDLSALLAAELFGVDAENAPLTRAAAMQAPAVARARNVLCPTSGRLPLEVFRSGSPEPVPGAILEQPEKDPARPRYSTILWTVDAQLFYGRAWWIVTARYTDTGRPRNFEWIPEWNADVQDGQLVATKDERHRNIRPENVVRIDGPHEGILNYGSASIRQALRMESAALRIAENPVPAIELHQTTPDKLDPDERQALIQGWIKARRQTGVGYTNAAIETKVHGLNPEQLIIEGRKYAALQIARMMGVPAWLVDATTEGSSLTYSNVPSRSRELVDYALIPYLAAIESRLSMDDVLPHGTWCRFNVDELLRGDFADRMNAYKVATDAGIYTPAELRAREDGRPVETTEDPA